MSTRTYEGHTQLVYDAVWSPGLPSTFASVAGKGPIYCFLLFSPLVFFLWFEDCSCIEPFVTFLFR